MAQKIAISLHLSEDEKTATVHMSGRSVPIVADCLGVERDGRGDVARVYLNALVHKTSVSVVYEHWEPVGAISSIFIRRAEGVAK